MASLDKASVREEVARLKADFEQLSRQGKVTPETGTLFKSLLLIVELILSIFLERQIRKTPKNSSLPPSQTDKDETSLSRTSGSPKRQPSSGTVANHRRVETVTVSTVENCDVCGSPLDGVECTGHERRTKIDIVFEKVAEHVDAEIKQCPECTSTVKGLFPADMAGPLQYGNGLKAYLVNLMVGQMLPLARTRSLTESLLGERLSESTLLNFVTRLHQALEGWEQSAIEQLMRQPAMHVDESGFRVEGKNHWIHVHAAGLITLKRLHRKRGKAAIEDINIIPRYGGAIIHDCWASYFAYDDCTHGLCGSHLLRELTFMVDAHGYAWARSMKRLLKETALAVRQAPDKCLDDKQYAKLQKRYRTILTRGEKALPPVPPRPTGKRGRLAKSEAQNLWERLKRHEQAVLRFAKDPHVAFTNNRAERDLRMAKVKQKVSGCFRTTHYAEAYCRISSYLQTMANQGYNPLIAIQMALAGESVTVSGGE
ncbi:IS66 family transposase [Thiohalomonas denitrificans]|uniref:IS66 family transposase n=1 Tax=Thiohalomonas denitrificans TaxID=415747 RepID=UPI0026F1DF33|nr:IS66 family transposase [Thiohalomonas denitrificans]